MLINLSNHPSKYWGKKQIQTATKTYGTIADISFPAINPDADSKQILEIAKQYFGKITSYFDECANTPQQNAVHIQGEFTFVFKLVNILKQSGIICLASTSERNVEFNENDEKVVKFVFVKFREY